MRTRTLQQKIRVAQQRNERDIIQTIKKFQRLGQGWTPRFMPTSWWNALGRLKDSGVVVYRSQGRLTDGYVLKRGAK